MVRRVYILIFLTFFVISPSLFAFSYESDTYGHQMIGFVDKKAIFTVSINQTRIPFDLDGVDVSYNATPEDYVRGIQIGTYSVIANTNYTLYISHSPLTLIGSSQDGKLTTVDYRLYVFGASGYQSILSDSYSSSMGTNPNSVENKISVAGSTVLENKGLYVSLDDRSKVDDENLQVETNMTREEASTIAVLSGLESGSYESTLYFLLVMGE